MEKEPGFSVSDLGGLSKPTTAMIEACRAAVGALYEPTRIRQEAKANAEACIILAEADAASREVAFRASERISYLEIRRQKNIESILSGAMDVLEENTLRREHVTASESSPISPEQPTAEEPSRPSEDWIHRFFDSCHDVGDEEMQSIWSQILAGEFSTPGKFPIRVLNVVSQLEKADADCFTRCCGLIWITTFCQGLFHLAEWDYKYGGNQFSEWGVSYRDRKHLENLGLLNLSVYEAPKEFLAAYVDGSFYSVGNSLDIGFDALTDVGEALAPISGAVVAEGYREWMMEQLRKRATVEEIDFDSAPEDVKSELAWSGIWLRPQEHAG